MGNRKQPNPLRPVKKTRKDGVKQTYHVKQNTKTPRRRPPRPKAAIFDMDGTLANVESIRWHVEVAEGQKRNFDKFHSESVNVPPNGWVAAQARQLHEQGVEIIIVTARSSDWRNPTAMWLALNNIPSTAMFMRRKGDQRPDYEVKKDILAAIRNTWEVIEAYDDNPFVIQLWEEEGIPTTVVPGWTGGTPASKNTSR